MRRAPALALALCIAACTRSAAPPPPRVRVHATVGPAALAVLAEAARRRGLAEVVAAEAGDAELHWVADPADVLALGDRVVEGAAPAPAGVAARWQDPRRRFAPVCARAAVLLVAPRGLPFAPERLRDLTDPRLAGRVALPPLSDGDRGALVGALSLASGEAATSRLLAALARNSPRLASGDEEVRALVAHGEAAVGLVMSEAAAAGAASAAGLEVVVPDQEGRGTLVLPTAVALAPGAPEPAHALADWLAGAEAEQLLVARVPGLMPLRDGVPVPVGVRPAAALRVLTADWDALAVKARQARAALAGWPAGWAR